MQKKLKETKTKETISFFVPFCHWWHFNWAPVPPLATPMTRKNLRKNDVCASVKGLFFDGRKDKVITHAISR